MKTNTLAILGLVAATHALPARDRKTEKRQFSFGDGAGSDFCFGGSCGGGSGGGGAVVINPDDIANLLPPGVTLPPGFSIPRKRTPQRIECGERGSCNDDDDDGYGGLQPDDPYPGAPIKPSLPPITVIPGGEPIEDEEEEPEKPDTGYPGYPDKPEEPETPDYGDEEEEEPEKPDTGYPGYPDTPEEPEEPEKPDYGDDEEEEPEKPDTGYPGYPDKPEEPEEPEKPDYEHDEEEEEEEPEEPDYEDEYGDDFEDIPEQEVTIEDIIEAQQKLLIMEQLIDTLQDPSQIAAIERAIKQTREFLKKHAGYDEVPVPGGGGIVVPTKPPKAKRSGDKEDVFKLFDAYTELIASDSFTSGKRPPYPVFLAAKKLALVLIEHGYEVDPRILGAWSSFGFGKRQDGIFALPGSCGVDDIIALETTLATIILIYGTDPPPHIQALHNAVNAALVFCHTAEAETGEMVPEVPVPGGPLVPEVPEDSEVIVDDYEDSEVVPDETDDESEVVVDDYEDSEVVPDETEESEVVPDETEDGEVVPDETEDGEVVPEIPDGDSDFFPGRRRSTGGSIIPQIPVEGGGIVPSIPDGGSIDVAEPVEGEIDADETEDGELEADETEDGEIDADETEEGEVEADEEEEEEVAPKPKKRD